MATKQVPAKGEVIEVLVWSYDPSLPPRLVNGRSTWCDGSTSFPYTNSASYKQMTVTDFVFWGDNSIDVKGLLEDGTKHTVQWEAPHGDLCY